MTLRWTRSCRRRSTSSGCRGSRRSTRSPRPSSTAAVGTEQAEADLLHALVVLDAEQLAHARLRARARRRPTPAASMRSPRTARRLRVGEQRADARRPADRRLAERRPGRAPPRRPDRTTSRCPSTPARWRASCEPPPNRRSRSPTTQSSGTNTSSRKTSLNISSPVSSRSGRMSMPGRASCRR